MFSSKKDKQKRKYTGFLGDCSEEQLLILNRFREFVRAHNNGQLNPAWDDVYLLRFLRARKFGREAEKMWIDYIDWRRKNNIDQIDRYYFPELSALRKMYPHGYHKTDKRFRPIYIERIGFIHPQEITKITTGQRLLSYYAMSYQTLLTKIFDACTVQWRKQTGETGRIMETVTILDLKDVKLSNAAAAYKFVKPASEMAQNNYPQILGNMFIINAPFLFTGIWAVVRMWIDDKTKEKIKILGSSYKKELLQYIDAQNLPDFIDGGKCRCPGGDCLSLNIGPWNPQGKQFLVNCFEKWKQEPVEVKNAEMEFKKQPKNKKEEIVQKQQLEQHSQQLHKQVENVAIMVPVAVQPAEQIKAVEEVKQLQEQPIQEDPQPVQIKPVVVQPEKAVLNNEEKVECQPEQPILVEQPVQVVPSPISPATIEPKEPEDHIDA